ncbi:MAG: hypothetical protein GY953_54500 [bacterium]|nr:hypothetical protein [bacterium]
MILQQPTHAASPRKIADLLEALSQLVEVDDRQYAGDEELQNRPCPHCGSDRTTLLAERLPPDLP